MLTVEEAAQIEVIPWFPVPTDPPVPIDPSVPMFGHRPVCVHLGNAIPGAFRDCKTCGGNVRLKVFGCAHPGHADQPTTTETECRACGDYTAQRAKEVSR